MFNNQVKKAFNQLSQDVQEKVDRLISLQLSNEEYYVEDVRVWTVGDLQDIVEEAVEIYS